MSYQTELDDDREDWKAMHDWTNFETPSSWKQDKYIKDLLSTKCLVEADFFKGELSGQRKITAKRANRLIKRGRKRQEEISLQKSKEASCH
jgi:hypothetical protein